MSDKINNKNDKDYDDKEYNNNNTYEKNDWKNKHRNKHKNKNNNEMMNFSHKANFVL